MWRIICFIVGHEWKGKTYLEYDHQHGSACTPLKVRYKCIRCNKRKKND